MALTVNISVASEDILVEIPEVQATFRYSNLVAYDRKSLALLSYGKSKAELKTEKGNDWASFQNLAAFSSLFDPHEAGPIFDYQVIELILIKLRDIASPHKLQRLIPTLYQPVDINLNIPVYNRLTLGRRRELEYYLFDFQKTENLTINGADHTIPMTRRKIQWVFGTTLRILIPSSLLLIGSLKIFSQRGAEIQDFLGGAIAWVSGAILAYFLGTILWLLLFRGLLPHGYLRYQLRFSGPLLRKATRWLADKLLN